MKPKYNSILILFLLTLFGSIFVGGPCSAQSDANNPKTPIIKPPTEKPIIIWFHSGLANSLESLETALSSGLITHVLLLYTNRADHDWKASKDVLKAIEIVKKSDAKLIWCRNMWAYWAIENAKISDLFDPKFYIREIHYLRTEGEEIGADFVGIDVEPYGKTPMRPYLPVRRGHIKLTHNQVQKLKLAINKAIEVAGKIDFMLPAGWAYYKDHPYKIIAELGDYRISESTYYVDDVVIKQIQYPYEIFGAHVNTKRWRSINPKRPFFLVSDIFENSQLWSSKKGLFLYSYVDDSLPVAKAMVAYVKTLPRKTEPQTSSETEQ